ncbi:MAG: hypothetical protein MZV63_42405 [Marinilabiliales bacterium]|nr:hypothetical protein [Marinilabiliales bacterium]
MTSLWQGFPGVVGDPSLFRSWIATISSFTWRFPITAGDGYRPFAALIDFMDLTVENAPQVFPVRQGKGLQHRRQF